MPKSLGQEILFTILMVLVMVYAMICYNIALATGGMTNSVFLLAFHELPIMAPVAFVLDFFIVGPIADDRMVRAFTEFEEGILTDKALLLCLQDVDYGIQITAKTQSACDCIRIEEFRILTQEEKAEAAQFQTENYF